MVTMKARWRLTMGLIGWLVVSAGVARAQWMTQEIPLQAGWNAVHVWVRPSAASFTEAFAGTETNVVGVWRWDKAFTTQEYLYDETSPLAPSPHWKVWYPGREVSFLSSMGEFTGGQSYLIQWREGAPNTVISLKGRARLPALEWYPNALNLVGFSVGAGGATVAEWFEATDGVDVSKGYDNSIFQIAPSGAEQTVVKPSLQSIRRGESLWVRCEGALDYTGPVRVSTDFGPGLDFGENVAQIMLTVENLSATNARTLTLKRISSEAAPADEEAVAGEVPLYIADAAATVGTLEGWAAFSEKTITLDPGATWQGRFGVYREEMEFREDLANTNSAYQSVLTVKDSAGKIEIDVPVRAVRTRSGMLAGSNGSGSDPLDSVNEQAGLWAGNAELTMVNCPNYRADVLLPVKKPASIRLLLHVNADGNTKLLREVWIAASADTNAIPGLYAARSLIPANSPTLQRLSTATLPEMAPLLLNCSEGDGAGLTGTLSGTVALPYDDPVNPFLHRYHPMFDNKDGTFRGYTNAVETRSVWRDVSLVCDTNAAALSGPATIVRGTYAETLRGLRAQNILVQGTFVLQKILAQGTLEELDQSGE